MNKDMGPGLMLDNNLIPTTATAMTNINSTENNHHHGQDPEPAFSDDEEEMPLR